MTSANPAIIRAARAKITPEGAWTQGRNARDAEGFACNPEGANAVCWCLRGSIIAVGGGNEEFLAVRDYVGRPTYFWNDDPARTHAEVLAALDGCVEVVEQQQRRTA